MKLSATDQASNDRIVARQQERAEARVMVRGCAGPFRVNDTEYGPGDVIEVTGEQAISLCGAGYTDLCAHLVPAWWPRTVPAIHPRR